VSSCTTIWAARTVISTTVGTVSSASLATSALAMMLFDATVADVGADEDNDDREDGA